MFTIEPGCARCSVGSAAVSGGDIARPGPPLTLTKPLGVGVLNNRHKRTGEGFEDAVSVVTTMP